MCYKKKKNCVKITKNNSECVNEWVEKGEKHQ